MIGRQIRTGTGRIMDLVAIDNTDALPLVEAKSVRLAPYLRLPAHLPSWSTYHQHRAAGWRDRGHLPGCSSTSGPSSSAHRRHDGLGRAWPPGEWIRRLPSRPRPLTERERLSWHLLEDVLGWVAVLLGSTAIHLWDLPIIDPLLSIVISLFLLSHVIRQPS